jgi:hypothetical protein
MLMMEATEPATLTSGRKTLRKKFDFRVTMS